MFAEHTDEELFTILLEHREVNFSHDWKAAHDFLNWLRTKKWATISVHMAANEETGDWLVRAGRKKDWPVRAIDLDDEIPIVDRLRNLAEMTDEQRDMLRRVGISIKE